MLLSLWQPEEKKFGPNQPGKKTKTYSCYIICVNLYIRIKDKMMTVHSNAIIMTINIIFGLRVVLCV